MDRKSLP